MGWRDAARRLLGRRAPDPAAGRIDDALRALRAGETADLARRIGAAHGVPVTIGIETGLANGDAHPLRWRAADGRATFTFDAALAGHPHARVLVERWLATLPLLLGAQRRDADLGGETWVNLADQGTRPGLAFCDHRAGFVLIPDPQFLASHGYARQKAVYARRAPPWAARRPVALWRGQTSGWAASDGHPVASWRDLPRVRLCGIARAEASRGLFDVALSGIAQLDEDAAGEVRASGLLGAPLPWQDFGNCKYQIDIDGNSNAWEGLFLKLCTASCVLKVGSGPGFRQWYYDRLVPWVNFVPVAPDMADLVETVDWLTRHDDIARAIGENGRALAASMSHERETVLAGPRIARSLMGRSAEGKP